MPPSLFHKRRTTTRKRQPQRRGGVSGRRGNQKQRNTGQSAVVVVTLCFLAGLMLYVMGMSFWMTHHVQKSNRDMDSVMKQTIRKKRQHHHPSISTPETDAVPNPKRAQKPFATRGRIFDLLQQERDHQVEYRRSFPLSVGPIGSIFASFHDKVFLPLDQRPDNRPDWVIRQERARLEEEANRTSTNG